MVVNAESRVLLRIRLKFAFRAQVGWGQNYGFVVSSGLKKKTQKRKTRYDQDDGRAVKFQNLKRLCWIDNVFFNLIIILSCSINDFKI